MVNNFNEKVSFIWSVADLLRGPYKPFQYGRVMLPLTVLRRMDCVLEPTKEKVLAKAKSLKGGKVNVKLPAAILKVILATFSERDEEAETCRDKDGAPEPDSDLRDSESVPLKEDVQEYFEREVLPHVPDAWIDEEATKIGYEIPLNRHFYQYTPPRPLEEIEADIKVIEKDMVKMLAEVTG